MKSTQTPILSKKKYLYNILDAIQVTVEVRENPLHLLPSHLFTMAARMNKKRSFLFVSKLIGKHLPILPQKGLLTSAILAARYFEAAGGDGKALTRELLSAFHEEQPSFNRKLFVPAVHHPIIIGFAETATALGQAFFDCFEDADYFHTTREVLQDQQPVFTFEEEHSHATSHRCYIPAETMNNKREVILVDDELTTGKTALNIIRSIHSRFPRTEYTVVSILDWRSEADRQKFVQLENLLGIKIHVISLLAGTVAVKQLKEIRPQGQVISSAVCQQTIEKINVPLHFSKMHLPTLLRDGTVNQTPFIRETGRFGLDSRQNRLNQQTIQQLGALLAAKRTGKKTLCLGTGEFIYIPMKLAAEMGPGVFFQSTTRSPIFIQNEENYGARYGLNFPNPEDMGISHYVYNIPPGYYDELFLFFEREVDSKNLKPLITELQEVQMKSIKIVYFSQK